MRRTNCLDGIWAPEPILMTLLNSVPFTVMVWAEVSMAVMRPVRRCSALIAAGVRLTLTRLGRRVGAGIRVIIISPCCRSQQQCRAPNPSPQITAPCPFFMMVPILLRNSTIDSS